jgi:D-beta-D-heptose 7-phosphate kinase/D-beta-D-heptose 1-phosphate adenosyltransferase
MTVCRQKIRSLQEIRAMVDEHRGGGKRIVFTNGCFDLLHDGHLRCLNEASACGDVLIVAINSDASVRRLKGNRRPIVSQCERAARLAALDFVDYILVFDDDTPLKILRELRPDVLVKGGTYRPDEVVGREFVESYGGIVRLTSAVEGISTSAILSSM